MIFKLFNYVRDLLLQHASHYFVSPQQNASRSVRFFYYEDTYKKKQISCRQISLKITHQVA